MYTRLQGDIDGPRLAAQFREHPSHDEYVQARAPAVPALAARQPATGDERAEMAPAATPPQSPARQLRILIQRYAEIVTRDRRNLWLLLLQAPIIAALAAVIAKPHALTELPDAAGSRSLLIIMSCSMIWLGAMNAAREIVKELPIYRRERMVGLGLAPYLASKYVVLGGLCLFQAATLLLGIGLRARLPAQGILLSGPLELYVTLLLSAVAGLAMGLMLSTLFNNADRATALIPYLLIPQIIFVVAKLEGFGSAVASLTISRWSLQALGATVDLAKFPAALGGLDPSEYTHSVSFLLSRWLILLAMAAAFAAAGLFFLKRHDGELM